MVNKKPGRPIDPFCKYRDAASLYRALKLCGFSGKSSLDLTSRITGIKENKIKSYDLETRDAKDGTGRRAKLDMTPVSDLDEVNNAKAGIVKHDGWLQKARELHIVDELNNFGH